MPAQNAPSSPARVKSGNRRKLVAACPKTSTSQKACQSRAPPPQQRQRKNFDSPSDTSSTRAVGATYGSTHIELFDFRLTRGLGKARAARRCATDGNAQEA